MNHDMKCNKKFASQKLQIKGTADPSRFISETNVRKSRIRQRTTVNLNDIIFNRFGVDLEIEFQGRCMSDPSLSDIDFKNKMATIWTTLKKVSQIACMFF